MRLALIFIIVALTTTSAAAQTSQTCGYGLPCGPVRWALPDLRSPTPISTIFYTVTPTGTLPATATLPATSTLTPTPTPTSGMDVSGVDESLATLQAVMAATQPPLYNELGTPVDNNAIYTELGANAGTFFGYARGMAEFNFGSLTPLIGLTFIAFVLILSVRLLVFSLPVFAAALGIIRKVVDFVLQFIPL